SVYCGPLRVPCIFAVDRCWEWTVFGLLYNGGFSGMSKLKILFVILLAACITAGVAVPWCEAAAKASPKTRITNLRSSVKGKRTCLIFDAEGARPKQIGPPTADGISVSFSQITAKPPDKVFKDG